MKLYPNLQGAKPATFADVQNGQAAYCLDHDAFFIVGVKDPLRPLISIGPHLQGDTAPTVWGGDFPEDLAFVAYDHLKIAAPDGAHWTRRDQVTYGDLVLLQNGPALVFRPIRTPGAGKAAVDLATGQITTGDFTAKPSIRGYRLLWQFGEQLTEVFSAP